MTLATMNKTLLQFPNLTTVYCRGDLNMLVTLGQLTKLSWNGLIFGTALYSKTLCNALLPWGHRLRSRRVEIA